MLLWIVFAVLTAAALTAVLSPLMRARAVPSPRSAHDAALYAHQLREIDSDLERGLISHADAQAARTEISRRLLRAAEREPNKASPTQAPAFQRRSAAFALIAAFLCLPVASLALYLTHGSPGLPDQPLSARLGVPAGGEPLAGLVARVEARLREHPEDGQGWDVIAPVYLRQQRYDDAADAYARARRLLGDNAARLAGHGEALVLANNGIVTEAARKALEAAIAADPSQLKPRFWLAMAKEQDGRFAEAAAAWRDMLNGAPADAPWRPMVEERLRATEAQAAAPAAAPSDKQAPSSTGRGPTQEDIAAAQAMTPEERQAMINQMVAGLAERLAKDGKDLEGWMRLVRAYSVLGRRDDATQALDSARRNFGGDQPALTRLDALATSLGL